MRAAVEALTDVSRAIVALRGAGLRLDSIELLDWRVVGDRSLATYRLRGTGLTGQSAESLGYACGDTPERIAYVLERWYADRAEAGPFGAGVRAIPGMSAALFLMPNDDRLPLLRAVTDLARLARVLTALPEFESAGKHAIQHDRPLEVVRYRPELELTARVSLQFAREPSGESRTHHLQIRHFADTRGKGLLADTNAWRTGGAAGVLARPLGELADGQLYVEELPEGVSLSETVRAGDVTAESVAAALATLHGAHTTFAHTRPADGRLLAAHAILGSLRGTSGLDDDAVASVAGPLTAALPASRALRPVHGSLHAKDIRTGSAGLVFTELDERAMGDPFDDWGSLIADLLWESRTHLDEGAVAGAFAARLTTLARAGAPERPAHELSFFIACTLLETVAQPARTQSARATEVRLALQLARKALVDPA